MNGIWKWKRGFQKEYLESGYDDASWEDVTIPHAQDLVPFHYLDEKAIWSVSTYRMHVSLPAHGSLERIARFEGVGVDCEVYFDGDLLFRHEGAYTPFEVVLPHDEGMLVVVVDTHEDKEVPPFGGACDYLVFGGIYRPVSFFLRGKEHITFLSVESRNGKEVMVRGEATSDGSVMLLLHDGEKAIRKETAFVKDGKLSYKMEGLSLELWDLKTPRLYRMDVTFMGYLQSVPFGCRDARFTFRGFFLNGKRVKLVGLNRHQCYPTIGYAAGARMQEQDAELLKRTGLNIVRCSHYPQSPAFLDACDKVGLLVFEEIPGWQWIGKDEHWRELCLRNVRDMVTRDVNHPSIVLWGVRINESQDDDRLYQITNAEAHRLDPGRQTGGVRNFLGSHLLEDVYTYNDFSHDGGNKGLTDPKVGAPYLVSEHNGHMFPVRNCDGEEQRRGQFLRHIAVLESAFANDRVSGAIGWCFADYQTHSNFGSGDGICYHGVYDQNRMPKFAAYAYISQQDKVPVLVSSSTFDAGDVPAMRDLPIVVATNCEQVDLYYGDILVKSFYPARKRYPHLPHPPVFIDDLYDGIVRNAGYQGKEGDKLVKILKKMGNRGMKLDWGDMLDMHGLMKRYKMDKGQAVQVASLFQGLLQPRKGVWRLDGLIGKKVVASECYGPDQPITRTLVSFDEIVHLQGEAETLRLVLCIGREGMTLPLPYAVVPYRVTVEGPLLLLSPSMDSTMGGVGGIYLKTTGEKGVARVKVTMEDGVLEKTYAIQ